MVGEAETPVATLYREREALLAKSDQIFTAMDDAETHGK
jgi:hypothetical protein